MSRNHRGRLLGEPVTRSLPAPAGGVQLETFVPWTLVKRGSNKQVITPQEFAIEARREKRDRDGTQDTPLMRALGLAHYWQRLLDEQRFASVAEVAEAEGIDVSRAYRLLRLTLLAPEIIEQLIAVSGTALEPMMRRSWPIEWHAQVEAVREIRSYPLGN
ncbi:hypothetical protein B7R77_09880 [Ralstonia solanacearum K60]|uniref:Bacteriophage-related protein n=1 Tax=Ralstonia solanacearum K60 TaxID=1091042 RepID=A0AAP8D490_RALSL|nr:hypothetical protein [Ralstonia solanacearum]OYQ13534.1 hypothetical protein B7R77_09880 [Ralstonia solanacearum K60]RIJ86603.1 hypothetical protein RSP822_08905 [Ralstonia solanacearum]CCF97675.1 putative bacteriophage-related protein [Ralstonia solanacearum K60]